MPLTLSPGMKGLSAALEKWIASQGKSYRSLPGVVGWGGICLVVQWVRSCPQMQRAQLRPLVGELRWPQLLSLQASTRETPTLRDKQPKHPKKRSCVPQLTPNTAKTIQINKENIFKTNRTIISLFVFGCAGSLLLCTGFL